jgi:CyaY protein
VSSRRLLPLAVAALSLGVAFVAFGSSTHIGTAWASEADPDFAMVSAGVLEIEFDDGEKIIVNRHGAAREIWVAARSGGFHFRWDGSAWKDTRDGAELFAALSRLVSAQSGTGVILSA